MASQLSEDNDNIDFAALRSSYKESSLKELQTKIEDMINTSGISKQNIAYCVELGFIRGQIAFVAHQFYQNKGPTAANDHIAGVIVALYKQFNPNALPDRYDIICTV